jgi:hypothetical protein
VSKFRERLTVRKQTMPSFHMERPNLSCTKRSFRTCALNKKDEMSKALSINAGRRNA